MQEIVDTVMSGPFLATLLAAVSAFATILALVMPILARDQLNQRMRVMALERDKLRSQRLAELSKEQRGKAQLRRTPKGFMQQIVDRFDLRAQFDNEELRNQLKMAGLRGEAPLVAFMFFRVAAPPGTFLVALFYLFVLADIQTSATMKLFYAAVAGGAGYYLPNIFIKNLAQKRQQAIKIAFPEALDMLLICVQSGMSVEASFGKVAKEVANQSVELGEELALLYLVALVHGKLDQRPLHPEREVHPLRALNLAREASAPALVPAQCYRFHRPDYRDLLRGFLFAPAGGERHQSGNE